ncbi:MAG: hypothetical protein AMXMBFR80_06650 [Dehalococcoidia bacterium]|nr:type II toxin-antitoxin system RelE/ParE family toxin [Tepidiformaceae bacterium]
MSYAYVMAGRAERYVSRLSPQLQRMIGVRLRELCAAPYDRDLSKPLKGPLQGKRSSELGSLRIIYEVDDTIRLLAIIDIGPRGDIYKR